MVSEEVERLRNVRNAMGLTQAQMAELVGLSFSAYSAIERGERTLKGKHLQALEGSDANIDYIKTGHGNPLKDKHGEELADMFANLPEDKQKLVMDLMKAMLEK